MMVVFAFGLLLIWGLLVFSLFHLGRREISSPFDFVGTRRVALRYLVAIGLCLLSLVSIGLSSLL